MSIVTYQHALRSNDYVICVADQKLYQLDDNTWSPLPYSATAIQQLIQSVNNCPCFFVGFYNGQRCFALEVPIICDDDWISLREQIPFLSVETYQLASRGLQLVTWYKTHQFCGQCGKPTVFDPAENALTCSPCQLTFYPRISPCMMCLIVRGEHCLLAHHARHPEGLFATLAGFVEAGESIEQTVHREVFEEVGLKVGNLSYFSSQSWPFPHQLMVGYFAEYESGEILVDNEEIVDARWFHYTQLPKIPASSTLSGQLIGHFVRECEQRAQGQED